MITKRDYLQAIKNLTLGITQLAPNGRSCVICEDTGHQAFECRFNPLVVAEKSKGFAHSWRCFHCNAVFTDANKAAEHFGEAAERRQLPACSEAGK